jgi:HSP20 family molecular chaperone IbpA
MSPTTTRLHESAAEIVIELELDLPGPTDELEVSLVDRTVTVSCGPDPDPEGFGKRASCSSGFRRELQLPRAADVDHLSATLSSGTLELRAPRRMLRPRRIPVRRPYQIDPNAHPD